MTLVFHTFFENIRLCEYVMQVKNLKFILRSKFLRQEFIIFFYLCSINVLLMFLFTSFYKTLLTETSDIDRLSTRILLSLFV